LLGNSQKVGVLSFFSKALTKEHFRRAGVNDPTKIAVFGLESLPPDKSWHGEKGITELEPKKRLEQIEDRMIYAAQRLVLDHPEVGAIVLECTNMPPAAAAIQEATGLPVFDVITLLNWANDAVVRRRYEGYI
jgi:hypothetical protein